MALWGLTDAEASRPKWINLNNYPAGTELVFVDATEAQVQSNKDRGINSPGWWLVYQYTDSNGTVRYRAENEVAVPVSAAVASDAADDAVVPDVQTSISITTQPADATTVLGEASFAVVATRSSGATLAYVWQVKAPGGRWTKLAGETSNTLALSGVTAASTGTQYRVIVSGDGAVSVTSAAASLTFGT